MRRQPIKVYLINLDRSSGRLCFMREQFGPLGLAVERVAAVDGSSIDLSAYAGSGLTPGEIGCFLSHRSIWKLHSSSLDDYALVIEDDIRLSKALAELLAHDNWIPASADLVKLDTSGKRIGVTKSASPVPGGRTLHRLRTVHTGSAGYIVSRTQAAALVERSAGLRESVDQFLFGAEAVADRQCGIFQVVPAVVAQEKRFNTHLHADLESLIRQERRAQRPSKLRRLGRNLWRPLRQAAALMAQGYRSATEDIRYLRVGYSQDSLRI